MKHKVSVKVNDQDIELELDATAFVKWENRAKAAQKPLSLFLSLFLTEQVQCT